MIVESPLLRGPVVLVCAVGRAGGAHAAAAVLACAGTAGDSALLVDVGGRPPRPTLLASAAARELEQRLAAHLPRSRVAARGAVCHLGVSAKVEGLDAAAAGAAVMRGKATIVHLPPFLLQEALGHATLGPSAVLLRADLAVERPLVALLGRELLERGLAVAVLKRRLDWAAERRALFGVLGHGSRGALPERLLRQLGLLDTGRAVPIRPAA
jgi:hypothetical protein